MGSIEFFCGAWLATLHYLQNLILLFFPHRIPAAVISIIICYVSRGIGIVSVVENAVPLAAWLAYRN